MSCKNINLSKNKSIEIQLDLFPRDDVSIFKYEFRANQKTDHAGIGLFIEIYKFVYFRIQFYDHRHWDYENKCWQKPFLTETPDRRCPYCQYPTNEMARELYGDNWEERIGKKKRYKVGDKIICYNCQKLYTLRYKA